jgi:hypothetical protein
VGRRPGLETLEETNIFAVPGIETNLGISEVIVCVFQEPDGFP